MNNYIETENLTKKYKITTAVDGVNLHAEAGTIYGLIGRNGAGKTTLLKLIAGLSVPTSGTVHYHTADGKRPRIGVLIEEPGLYYNLTARDNLEIKRIALNHKDIRETDELIDFVGLSQYADMKVRTYSLGMRQRLGIALALVGDPDLLILDEPVNGLDPQGIREVRLMLEKLKRQGKTILISSHLLEELSKIADQFGIMERGQLIREATEEDLLKSLPGYIRLMADPLDEAKKVLESMNIFSYQTKGACLLHIQEQLDRSDEILKNMVNAGIRVTECRVVHDSLETYFIDATKEEL